MTRLLVALTLAVLLSCFEFGWRVELPPMPKIIPQLHAQAAPAAPGVECVEWAKVPPWVITRCENWEAGETCLIANSGMIVCRFE